MIWKYFILTPYQTIFLWVINMKVGFMCYACQVVRAGLVVGKQVEVLWIDDKNRIIQPWGSAHSNMGTPNVVKENVA